MNAMRRTVTLLLTDACNLSCIYCYEHNKSHNFMSFETAKTILDKELSSQKIEEPIVIDLFGGEPFLNFDLMKQIVEYVMSAYPKHNKTFFTTTNGTLVHGNIQKWLIAKKKNLTCGLSLDGNETAHNINRSNSYSDIDLEFFKNIYPYQPIKMTISGASLPYLAESVRFLTEYGFKVQCNFAEGIDWASPQYIKILQDQLDDLIDYYIDTPEIEKCRLLNFEIGILSRPRQSNNEVNRYCGSGRYMRCYNLDGVSYPCQMFSPISAGDKAIPSAEFIIKDKINITELDNKCQNCYFLPLCPMCIGSNYLSTGSLYKVDDYKCKLQKIVFAANAKLKALEWEKGLLHFEGDEEQALLKSIIEIQDINV